MAEIDLHKEYNSSGESVQDLFDRTEEGFFVPLYQREYTWEEDNINQLFDDTLGDKEQTVKPGEVRAQPTAVQIVIDGQQRISTLALISIQITVKLQGLLEGLPKKDPYSDLHNAGEKFTERLAKLHTIELGKGANPSKKPKIIRAGDDAWTYKGEDTAYGSPVARYIATFVRTASAESALASVDTDSGTRVRGNVMLINELLDAVCDAHIPGTSMYDQFPVGERITSCVFHVKLPPVPAQSCHPFQAKVATPRSTVSRTV